jgi:pseudouridine 5'-phosphatase
MPSIHAVAFDLDGLMFNTEEVYWKVGTELMRRRGRKYDKALSDAVMGRPPRYCFETFIRWHSLDDTWEDLRDESEEIFISLLDDGVGPMPGLLKLLDALETAGIPKAICTSSSRSVLTAVLAPFEMESRFQFTLTAADITQGKPHPEVYLKAADQFGVKPPEMLVLEDSQTGCKSAAAAAAFTVAVPGDLTLDHDFSFASLVIESLEDTQLYKALGLAIGN